MITKEKRAEYDKKYYSRHRDKRLELNNSWRNRRVEWFRNFKKTLKCSVCGESNSNCIQFHHKEPSKKEINISTAARTYRQERLLKEIEKCEILCIDCHSKIHYQK